VLEEAHCEYEYREMYVLGLASRSVMKQRSGRFATLATNQFDHPSLYSGAYAPIKRPSEQLQAIHCHFEDVHLNKVDWIDHTSARTLWHRPGVSTTLQPTLFSSNAHALDLRQLSPSCERL